MAIQSGHGSTLAFGTTTTFAPGYTSINLFGAERPKLDTSTLATTGARTSIGGDLFDVSSFTASYLLDAATMATGGANSIDDLLFSSGDVAPAEAATITYPSGHGITGDAFAMGFEHEALATDAIIAASITVQYQDWPTFTVPGP